MDKIGRYQIRKSLGGGGMGEVFLAYDPICEREVALKQIKPELKDHPVIKERFLREAHVAAQLAHPSIIPIFSIDPSQYYTMPYVEGETLKKILKTSLEEEKAGEVQHPIGSSIPALARIFLAVCEAIAYTHSKGIVHRDLKPDNIIVGKYGEVLLLDWGLADFIGKSEKLALPEEEDEHYKDLTRPGKVPGTLNYIAPERLHGEPSQPGIDIYSLGVILYQLLTLRIPFPRSSVKNFRKTVHLEQLIDPLEIAPYRDIPQHLADITKKCLHFSPQERFQSVDEIIVELKNFLEGKPEWTFVCELKIEEPKDWEFQENVLFARHMAITRSPEEMEWVNLMISKSSFSGNTKIETRIKLGRESQGIGLLIGIPEASERKDFSEGYCFWIGRECRLIRSDVEVMAIPELRINDQRRHEVCLEKVDQHLFIFIDGKKVCHYISHIPLAGTHVGIVCRDADFEIDPVQISVGSQNVMVNCLAVPDAFLANKNYAKALLEYRRIASSFAGRSEGREALFRAGITLLEKASSVKSRQKRQRLLLLAHDEFGKLRSTPGAPLEYLGKSLVYKASGEIEEEIKCLELALRKYPKHPLLRLIREHITFRLHEVSSHQRIAAFHFALLALRHLPQIFTNQDNAKFVFILKKHLEKLPIFLLAQPEEEYLACQLAFWLAKPITLIEMVETSSSPEIIANALFALLAMGKKEWVEENLQYLENRKLIEIALIYFDQGCKDSLKALSDFVSNSPTNAEMRCAYFLFEKALLDKKSSQSISFFSHFPPTPFLDALHIESCLRQGKFNEARALFETYPEETLSDEYSPFFPLMGCYLAHQESKDIALSHFGGSIDLPHPPTPMLLSYFLQGKIHRKKGWMTQAFPWEKAILYRHVSLYYHCTRAQKKEKEYNEYLKRELKKLKFHD